VVVGHSDIAHNLAMAGIKAMPPVELHVGFQGGKLADQGGFTGG
jgi:hypothetical protein